jgi:hypothetical protein
MIMSEPLIGYGSPFPSLDPLEKLDLDGNPLDEEGFRKKIREELAKMGDLPMEGLDMSEPSQPPDIEDLHPMEDPPGAD